MDCIAEHIMNKNTRVFRCDWCIRLWLLVRCSDICNDFRLYSQYNRCYDCWTLEYWNPVIMIGLLTWFLVTLFYMIEALFLISRWDTCSYWIIFIMHRVVVFLHRSMIRSYSNNDSEVETHQHLSWGHNASKNAYIWHKLRYHRLESQSSQ